ncbi:MAG: hemolysin family protein [Lentisphaeria bacterium]|jgi:putative hemolysin|nr:hemolysin family protein [Lentisphaeria bacterium]
MEATTVQMLLGALVLLFFSGFFSASETALLSLSRMEVKRMSDGTRAERAACQLLRRPQHLLATVLVGNLFVNVLLASICATLITRLVLGNGSEGWFVSLARLWDHDATGETVRHWADVSRSVLNVLLVTPLLIIFGEQTPKVVAYALGPAVVRLAALPLRWFGIAVAPLVWLLHMMTVCCLRVLGQTTDGSWSVLTNEELLATMAAGQEGGATNERERDLLVRILGLSDIDIKEIMVPRIQVAGIADDLTLREAFAAAKGSRHSRMPVYHEDLDDIWALLSFVDYPRWRDCAELDRKLSDFRAELEAGQDGLPLYQVYNVPETADLDLLLSNMRKRAERFAVVIGEHGGTSGIVTLNDILEEVVGRFSGNEDDEDRLTLRQGVYVADGRAHLRTLQREFGDDFSNPDGNADTIGGLVMERLGRLPRTGDCVELPGHLIRVNRMAGRRVGTVGIMVRPRPGDVLDGPEVEA